MSDNSHHRYLTITNISPSPHPHQHLTITITVTNITDTSPSQAAFSTALQCIDLLSDDSTPQWVCLKVRTCVVFFVRLCVDVIVFMCLKVRSCVVVVVFLLSPSSTTFLS